MSKSRNRKNDRFSFADFLKELTDSGPAKPEIDSKDVRQYFLIVSEGLRTEPLYFEMLAEGLPRHLVETIDVEGAGANTVSVVKTAVELRKKRNTNKELPPYDQVWAVYDKDDFPDKNYHGAIDLAGREGILSAHSNESFELWYILHFEYLQSALKRDAYISKLSKYLQTPYQKNNKALAKRIREEGNVELAIKRAARLEALHTDCTPAAACPHTRVYVLVERLLAYCEKRTARY